MTFNIASSSECCKKLEPQIKSSLHPSPDPSRRISRIEDNIEILSNSLSSSSSMLLIRSKDRHRCPILLEEKYALLSILISRRFFFKPQKNWRAFFSEDSARDLKEANARSLPISGFFLYSSSIFSEIDKITDAFISSLFNKNNLCNRNCNTSRVHVSRAEKVSNSYFSIPFSKSWFAGSNLRRS